MEHLWVYYYSKFSKCLQKRYGMIPGVTDKNYITNSYHVHVKQKKIDASISWNLNLIFKDYRPVVLLVM